MRLLGAVLVGGQSARMGATKAALRRADGATFAEGCVAALRAVCDDVVLLGHGEGCPPTLRRLEDMQTDVGPLGGLLALLGDHADAFLILPCDHPAIDERPLRRLIDVARAARAAAATFHDETLGPLPLPLFVVRDALSALPAFLDDGNRRLRAFVDSLAPLRVSALPSERRALRSVNDPAQLARLQEERQLERVELVRYDGERRETLADELAVEEPLELRVQGVSIAVTMRTPGNDEELAAGFLLTERIVERAEDIRSMRHCFVVQDPEAEENILDVFLADEVEIDLERMRRNLFASSSCGVCGKATIESALARTPAVVEERCLPVERLYGLPERLRAEQKLFARTGGLHAAALFDETGALLVTHEDISRHNAVDKVIGWSLRTGRRAEVRGLFVSGRVSFEVVQKAAAANIAVVAGVSAPSSLAVRFGEELGVTVVGFLRGEGLNVYSRPARVGP